MILKDLLCVGCGFGIYILACILILIFNYNAHRNDPPDKEE